MSETQEKTMSLEEMRAAVEAADAAEAEKAAADAAKRDKPYKDFKSSSAFKKVMADANALRAEFVEGDDTKFTMLNSLVSIMKRM